MVIYLQMIHLSFVSVCILVKFIIGQHIPNLVPPPPPPAM